MSLDDAIVAIHEFSESVPTSPLKIVFLCEDVDTRQLFFAVDTDEGTEGPSGQLVTSWLQAQFLSSTALEASDLAHLNDFISQHEGEAATLNTILSRARDALLKHVKTQRAEPRASPEPATQLFTVASNAIAVRSAVRKWARNHDGYRVHVDVDKESARAKVQVSEHSKPLKEFTVVCSPDWHPLACETTASSLQEPVRKANALLLERLGSNNPSVTFDELLEEMFIVQRVVSTHGHGRRAAPSSSSSSSTHRRRAKSSSYDQHAAFHDSSDSSDDDDARMPTAANARLVDEMLDATNENWQRVMIPAVRKFLRSAGSTPAVADQYLARIDELLSAGLAQEAARYIVIDLFGFAGVPRRLRRFFAAYNPGAATTVPRPAPAVQPPWMAPSQHQQPEFGDVFPNGTTAGRARLQRELRSFAGANKAACERRGFAAEAVTLTNGGMRLRNVYHWNVYFFNFSDTDADERALGEQLQRLFEQLRAHSAYPLLHRRAQVHMEVRFGFDFPDSPPMFRIVDPLFEGVGVVEAVDQRAAMTVSAALEQSAWVDWQPQRPLVDLVASLRQALVGARPRLAEHAADAPPLATVGSLWERLLCVSPLQVARNEVERGGKVLLPSALLTAALGEQEQHEVMLFEVCSAGSRRTFCGVLEFSAPDDMVVMPGWMMAGIGVDEGATVQVRRVDLPKATFVRFRPHRKAFFEAAGGDAKAALEWVLPNYPALTSGDTITVTIDGERHQLDVLDVQPGRSVCTIDADVTVDFAMALDDTEVEAVAAPKKRAKRAPRSTALFADSSSDEEEAPTTRPPPSSSSSGGDGGATTSTTNEGELCANCRRHIPSASMTMHAMQCARINWYCEQCGVAVRVAERAEHEEREHREAPCANGCGAMLLRSAVAAHACPEEPTQCPYSEYCGMSVKRSALAEHLRKCAVKTEVCEHCQQRVTRQDLGVHICGGGVTQPVQQQQQQQQQQQRRLPTSADAMLCPQCQERFFQFDDLQVHMLVAHNEEV